MSERTETAEWLVIDASGDETERKIPSKQNIYDWKAENRKMPMPKKTT